MLAPATALLLTLIAQPILDLDWLVRCFGLPSTAP